MITVRLQVDMDKYLSQLRANDPEGEVDLVQAISSVQVIYDAIAATCQEVLREVTGEPVIFICDSLKPSFPPMLPAVRHDIPYGLLVTVILGHSWSLKVLLDMREKISDALQSAAIDQGLETVPWHLAIQHVDEVVIVSSQMAG